MKNIPSCEEIASFPKGPIDFAIVTALPIERDAVLQCLGDYREIKEDSELFTYYHSYVTIPTKNECYQVVVVMQLEMGNTAATATTTAVIRRWQPKNLIMVGIAGGVREKVGLGDIVVADFCYYYELAKKHPKGEQRRPKQFPSCRTLYGRALAYKSNQWHNDIQAETPETALSRPYLPKVYYGAIGCGEKVITDKRTLARLVRECPQLFAVAMEGAGAAQASTYHVNHISFIEIRGICDFADEQKNDVWHPFAANAVAAYTIGLLRSRPVPPLPPSLPRPQSVDSEKLSELQQMLNGADGMPTDKNKLIAMVNDCLPSFRTYSIPSNCQELNCLLEFLGNQIGRLTDGRVPLLCFVNRLIPLVKSPTLRDNLKQWVETVGESCFGLSQDEIKKLWESEPPLENLSIDRHQTLSPVLSVVVEPAEKQEVIAKVWFKAETKPLVTKSLRAENWQEEISNIVKTLIETELYDDLQNATEPLTIEFFLPTDWLCHEIERLTPESCAPIGVDYRVVTRSQERLKNKSWHLNWKRHWNRCKGIMQKAPNTCVAWLENPSQGFYSLLEEGSLFFILTFVPKPGDLINLISAGMSMALCARQTDEEISQELKNFLSCDKLEKLPELVRRKRQTTWELSKQSDLGCFSLFWDDPDRPLYKLQKLQTPS